MRAGLSRVPVAALGFVSAILALTWTSRLRGDEPVLHEYVPDVDPNEAVIALSERQAEPSAIIYDGEVLAAPQADDAGSEAPAMIATAGDGQAQEQPGQRSPTFRPDRLTELEGTLDYHAAFRPAIAPFKRVTSLDATRLDADGLTPLLAIADERRRPVPVEGAAAAAPDARPRDRFWGEARLDFRSGREVPLPSVSPESRILTLRTEPQVDLRIERDGADNMVAVLRGKAPPVPVFVAFLTDAPRSYFGTTIPRVPADRLAAEVPPLDASIRARALGFASQLGIGPGDDLRSVLFALTAHFRSFEESADPPRDSGDIYLDLVRAQKGVCRHRAYGFVVTAHALGIPARFVQNEAHSWVEVKLPELGFMRIDLGGAAHGLTAHGTSDRPHYHPEEPDTLPRPPAYEESYSLAAQQGTGGGGAPVTDDLAGRWVSPGEPMQGSVGPSDLASSSGSPDADAETPSRIGLSFTLDQRRVTVLRGGKLAVSGRIRDDSGRGVGGLRVEVSLAAPERRERMLLGVGVSDENGYFRSSLGVPLDLEVGDYRLVVLTPGNDDYLPAVAQ